WVARDTRARAPDTPPIARRLVVSDATVETHIRQSMQRLGVPTRLAAAVELRRRRGDPNRGARRDQQISVGVTAPFQFPKTAISVESLPVAPWRLDPTMI